MAILHYKTRLLKAADTSADSSVDGKETRKHIGALLNFVDSQVGNEMRQEIELHKQSPPVATFGNFWMLFDPSCKVFCRKDEMDSVWVVDSIQGWPGGHFDVYHRV